MDKAYEDDKTIALVKAHGFHAVISPKKNRKSRCLYDKQLYRQRNIIERYFPRLKRFKKFLVVMTNLILFLFSLFLFLLFSICYLCEHHPVEFFSKQKPNHKIYDPIFITYQK